MGQIIAGQWKPYQYLVESIRKFPDQVNLLKLDHLPIKGELTVTLFEFSGNIQEDD